MRKGFVALLSAAFLATQSGCSSPLGNTEKITRETLKQRLDKYYKPPERQVYARDGYEIREDPVTYEPILITPAMERVFLWLGEEYIESHVNEDELPYRALKAEKKVEREVKKYTHFDIMGWKIRINIKTNHLGIGGTLSF